MAKHNEVPVEPGYEELGPVGDESSEAQKSERADQVYARYSAAMTFFGETPTPKGKRQRD